MADRRCSITGCNDVHKARGWCSKHYGRWQRQGDPLANLRPPAQMFDEQECRIADRVARGEMNGVWRYDNA